MNALRSLFFGVLFFLICVIGCALSLISALADTLLEPLIPLVEKLGKKIK